MPSRCKQKIYADRLVSVFNFLGRHAFMLGAAVAKSHMDEYLVRQKFCFSG